MANNVPAVIPVQEFYTQLTTNGVRLQHQYQLAFNIQTLPEINDVLKNYTIWAQGSEVPSRTQNYTEINYLAYPFQQATNAVMSSSMNSTVNCDAYMTIRDALLVWVGTITDPHIRGGAAGGGLKRATYNEAYVHLYDETMKTAVASYRLVGITPENVGTIQLSNQGGDIATFEATFRYQFWEYVLSANQGVLNIA